MPKRRLANPLHSIGSLMDSLRKLQSDAERTLERGAIEPSGPTGPQQRGGLRPPLRASIEKQLAEGLARLLERLDLPSRSEIDALSRRVARLEEGLGSRREVRRRRPDHSHDS